LLSLRKIIVWGSAAVVVTGVLGYGFRRLEPVKARRLVKATRSLPERLFAKPKPRSARLRDYVPTTLSEPDPGEVPVRLLALPFRSSEPASLQRASVSLDAQRRYAVAADVPSRFSYTMQVPESGYLSFGVNRAGGDSSSGKVCFAIDVSAGPDSRRMYDSCLPAAHTGWKDNILDLASFAGRQVEMRFRVSAGDSRRPGPGLKAFWSELYLGARTSSEEPFRIFVILIDTLRPDHLGCYGYERATSPIIDRLARQGVLFERAISAAPWTNPSVLSLFTALYPSDLWQTKPHAEAIRMAIPPEAVTLAEILATNGYLTIGASDHPGINQGLFGQGFDIYAQLSSEGDAHTGLAGTDPEMILNRLRELLAPRPGPVFTYLHLMYPHMPYDPPSPYDNLFGRGVFHFNFDNSKDKDAVINMYDGEIRYTDDFVGAFLDELGRLGLAENSLVVLLSDHGEGFWEHGLFEHGNSLYNELLHVPLILWAPGKLPAGKRVPDLVRTVDLLPTILDLVGAGGDSVFRGRSLLPLLDGGEHGQRLAYSESPHVRIVKGKTIQSETGKVIWPNTRGAPPEYYDLVKDPGEHVNQYKAAGEELAKLERIMEAIGTSAREHRAAFTSVQHAPSKDLLRRLKTLGYIH